MVQTDIASTLIELLEPAAAQHGFELVTVEQTGGRKSPVIRVLLDREDGLDIDAICEANRWISDLMDEHDPIPGPYTLEVSSPGIDRPLRTREHFERYAGETVTVKKKPAYGERTAWTGTLIGIEGDDVVIDVSGEQVRVPFQSVQKARLKGVVDFKNEGGARS